jgi:hypothetical protein
LLTPHPPPHPTPPRRITNKDYGCFHPSRDVTLAPYFPGLWQTSKQMYLEGGYKAEDKKSKLLFFAGGVRMNDKEYSGGWWRVSGGGCLVAGVWWRVGLAVWQHCCDVVGLWCGAALVWCCASVVLR